MGGKGAEKEMSVQAETRGHSVTVLMALKMEGAINQGMQVSSER